jgi:hypothetical protein
MRTGRGHDARFLIFENRKIEGRSTDAADVVGRLQQMSFSVHAFRGPRWALIGCLISKNAQLICPPGSLIVANSSRCAGEPRWCRSLRP